MSDKDKNASLAIDVVDLSKTFAGKKSLFGSSSPSVNAVQGISLQVEKGQTLGIVGESGCGKSTLARMLVGLLPPSSGRIVIEGQDLSTHAGDPAAFGRLIQYDFQDPIASLNPRKTIRQILETPLIHLLGLDESARKQRIAELLEAVSLNPAFLNRYPHEFSGGQAQRIGIARALAASPRILVLDEPVSALDVSVQAQVLNLLEELRDAMDLTYLFISHDLAVVEAVSDCVAVLYFGRVVEKADASTIFTQPRHPYTHLLSRSAPQLGRALARPEQEDVELPDPCNPPAGCAFEKRCAWATAACGHEPPDEVCADGPVFHAYACYNPVKPA